MSKKISITLDARELELLQGALIDKEVSTRERWKVEEEERAKKGLPGGDACYFAGVWCELDDLWARLYDKEQALKERAEREGWGAEFDRVRWGE